MIKKRKKLIHSLESDDVPSTDILSHDLSLFPVVVPEVSWVELTSAKNCRKVSPAFVSNKCHATFVALWQISNAIGVSNEEGRGWNERFRDARL